MPNTKNPVAHMAPLKKTWVLPTLVLISTNQITAKNIPQVRESTGHLISLPSAGYKVFANASNTRHVVISSHSVQQHQLSSLAS